MSGIAGAMALRVWDPGALASRMLQALVHDPANRVELWQDTSAALGHVRSRVDRSGAQPVSNREEFTCAVMAGEFHLDAETEREMARKGSFAGLGHAGTEYALGLCARLGAGGLARLSGSYCLAFYDAGKREVILASDRLGSRPLFYAVTADGTFVFGTQVSAVLQCAAVSRELDVPAALEFCALQRVIGEKTYHKGVKMLLPGSVLRYSAGGLSISPYWQLEYKPQAGSADEYAEALAATLRSALRRITRGARTGVLLSGGLDSRIIVAAAEDELKCFTFGDYENPESRVASQVAAARGFPFLFLKRDPDHYPRLVDTAVEIGSGMHPFNHAHAIGFLDAIGSECDVLTHGYGVEILFRGTSLPKRPSTMFGRVLGKQLDPTLDMATLPGRLFERGYNLLGKGVSSLLAPAAKRELKGVLDAAAAGILRSAEGHTASVFDAYIWLDVYFRGRFPSFLFEMSMRPFINERTIDFDNEVLELHQRMPVGVRADNSVWLKALMRLDPKVARVVSANTGYSPYAPQSLIAVADAAKALKNRLQGARRGGVSAGKLGATGAGLSPRSWPRFDWMIRNNAEMRRLITDTLQDPAAMPERVFDLARVKALLADHLEGRGNHRDVLFALLTFGRWHKRFGEA